MKIGQTTARRSFGLLLAAGVVLAGVLLVLVPVAASSKSAAAAPTRQATLTVFAASSLTDAFRELGAAFEAERGVPVTFNFGASSQLRTQLEHGAVADVFASADQVQMDHVREAGLVSGTDLLFATNRLVVITPRSNPSGIRSAADLAHPGVKLVTAAPAVPIGAYTQSMFQAMSRADVFGANFKDRVNANIVSREPNVRQVVAKVQLGEADAAVVYLTDITPASAPDLLTIPIPDDLNTLTSYPLALVAGGPQPELGQAFIDLVLSPTGQAILEAWNFTPVGPTMLVPAPAPAADRLALGTLAPGNPVGQRGVGAAR